MRRANPSKPPARTTEALRQSNVQRPALSLDEFLKNTLDGIFALDRDRRFVVFNAAAERITGYSAREVIGTNCSCHAFIDCHDEQGRSLAGFLCPARHLGRNSEAEGARQRMRIRRKDGAQVWVETIYTPLRDAAGEIDLFLGIMRDITEIHARESDLIATLSDLRAENARLLEERRSRFGFATIVSRSARMQSVFELIQAATTGSTAVLIHGERGTGKDLVARTIHEHGPQSSGPFVAPSARRDAVEPDVVAVLESARGGTVYIDNLARLPGDAQQRLAAWLTDSTGRAAKSKPRVIASLIEDPAAALNAGKLRADLLSALSPIYIHLPSLRLRREDIPSLVQHFLEQLNADGGRRVADISPKAWSVLLAYAWPGNVAELAKVVQSAHAAGKGPMLQTSDLPGSLHSPTGAADSTGGESLRLDPLLERVERQAILDALRQAKGQRNMAAKLMGISRSRLYRRMEVLNILQQSPGDVT